ncbi:hypothetical protein JOD02_000133 [Caldicoprobacter guelmensis]|uniref:copper transporter n=1 Tax=Caldicoprobacter guelmensis TaxID=1170224 RepID=UPI00195A1998|nr:copper transporter [Caldicoprobacter guelmensis]MBM7581310.1 hypothetical protein [Caldicoprobacter guelmensis]
MLHLKYYVILLIGIFLALGLGILIGVTLESNNVLENQQELIIKEIEKEFEALRGETEMLKKALAEVERQKAQLDSTCEYLFSQLIDNRLQGLKVSIISLHDDDGASDLMKFLKLAGASVESTITVGTDFYAGQDVSAALEAFFPNTQGGIDTRNFRQMVAMELVSSIVKGAFTPLSVRLREMRLIHTSSDLKQGSDVVILSSKGKNEQPVQGDGFDIVLIQAALDMGLPIVAVESSSVKSSVVSEYQELGIPAIRDIDTIYGKLALISILEANKSH